MLIALVGTLAFAAVWFTVLRPKSSTTETAAPAASQPAPSSDASSGASASAPSSSSATPSAPGVGVTENVSKAQAAADTANGKIAADGAQANAVGSDPSASASQSAAPAGTSGAGSSSSASADAASAAGAGQTIKVDERAPAAERAVIEELAQGKTVVMLFWDRKAADDRAARRAVREATSGRKNVAVKIVPASKVGEYESITGGVTIERSPTTLIIGPQRKAVTISGLVDELEIRQAITRMSKK